MRQQKVLFVCMGNICRSPTAEGVFRQRVEGAGLESEIEIDSAGTHAYHIGNPPDPRAQSTARNRGIELGELLARRVCEDDFINYDYVIAMDKSNYEDLKAICPSGYEDRIHLFLKFGHNQQSEVPDPYYGSGNGFEIVLDLIEDAADGLLEHLQTNA